MAIKAQALTVTLTAINASTGVRKTGDAANISVRLIKDGASGARHDTTELAEVDGTNCPGEYKVVLDATDTNANCVVVTGKSTTSNVEIIPVKIITEQGVLPGGTLAGGKGGLPILDSSAGTALKGYNNGDVTIGKSPATLATGDVTGNLPAQVKGVDTDAIDDDALSADAVTKIKNNLMVTDLGQLEYDPDTLAGVLYDIRQRCAGKVVVDHEDGTVTVYDAAGTTPLFILTMSTELLVDTVVRTAP